MSCLPVTNARSAKPWRGHFIWTQPVPSCFNIRKWHRSNYRKNRKRRRAIWPMWAMASMMLRSLSDQMSASPWERRGPMRLSKRRSKSRAKRGVLLLRLFSSQCSSECSCSSRRHLATPPCGERLFGDVGVTLITVFNAMRMMHIAKQP